MHPPVHEIDCFQAENFQTICVVPFQTTAAPRPACGPLRTTFVTSQMLTYNLLLRNARARFLAVILDTSGISLVSCIAKSNCHGKILRHSATPVFSPVETADVERMLVHVLGTTRTTSEEINM